MTYCFLFMSSLIENPLVLKSLKKRQDSALKQLYDLYWRKMFNHAFKILENQGLCEDIIQEIFISFWENAATKEIKNTESYLFTALKYKISNCLRDRKYISINVNVLESLPSNDFFPSLLEYNDLEGQILQTMDELPEKCRNVFYLSRMKDYSNQEIAVELNISKRTVETHISKALKHFKNSDWI